MPAVGVADRQAEAPPRTSREGDALYEDPGDNPIARAGEGVPLDRPQLRGWAQLERLDGAGGFDDDDVVPCDFARERGAEGVHLPIGALYPVAPGSAG